MEQPDDWYTLDINPYISGKNWNIPYVESRMDRLLADLIDDMGGRKSLDAFLSNKLKTAIVDWKDELTIKQSTKQIDESPCKLLQGSSIYRGKNELILWDTTYFYRFKLGADFKY